MNASVARRIVFSAIASITAAFVTATTSPVHAAGVRIVSPAPEQILPGPDVPVCVVTEGIEFVPGGCNLHIILDDGPFAVQYDPAHPYLLRDVAPGSHTLRVFAADRLHRALPGTLDVITFSVGYQDDANRPARGYPLLTVNLPQGEYLGVDAGDVAVDFLVDGACLSRRGYHVAYYVDGRKFFAYGEGARHLKGLPPGFHTVRVELLNEFGEQVPGRYNSWEKVILLSPHKTRHIPTEEEVRRGLPIIESIKGAMTNGQPWVAADPGTIPLPRATGVVPAAGAPGAYASTDPAAPLSDFAVRPGGRRVGPIPEPVEAPVGMAPFPVEAPVAAGPGPAVADNSAALRAPSATGLAPAASAVTSVESLTVAPAQGNARGKAAAVETEESEATEKEEEEEESEDDNGGTGANSSGAAARNSDGATTAARDLRPAGFRRYDAPTTRTLRTESTATGTTVRNVPPRRTPVADGSSVVVTQPVQAAATPRAARAGGADRDQNQNRRANRRSGGKNAAERANRNNTAIPDPNNQLPEPDKTNGRVGP